MTHPCADHPCDHCYSCDVLGVCCASAPSGRGKPGFQATPDQNLALHSAVLADIDRHVGLGRQIQLEARREASRGLPERLALPQGPPALTEEYPNRKDAYVSSSRSSR